jgi:hypothetical protein
VRLWGRVPVRLEARSQVELAAITDLIHDAYFDPDAIAFDEGAGRLVVPFQQEDVGEQRESGWELLRTTWLYDEHRVPFYAGTLTVENVTRVERPEDFGDVPMLVEIGYEPKRGRVRIDAYDPLDATVEGLHVTAELTTEVALNMRRRTYRRIAAERDKPM